MWLDREGFENIAKEVKWSKLTKQRSLKQGRAYLSGVYWVDYHLPAGTSSGIFLP